MYLDCKKVNVARIYIYLRYSMEKNAYFSFCFEEVGIYNGGTELWRFEDNSYRIVYNEGLVKAIDDAIANFVARPYGLGTDDTLLVDRTAELLLYCEQCDCRKGYACEGYGFELLDVIKLERDIDNEVLLKKMYMRSVEI